MGNRFGARRNYARNDPNPLRNVIQPVSVMHIAPAIAKWTWIMPTGEAVGWVLDNPSSWFASFSRRGLQPLATFCSGSAIRIGRELPFRFEEGR